MERAFSTGCPRLPTPWQLVSMACGPQAYANGGHRTGCEFWQSFEPFEVVGEKRTQAESVHQEHTGQKTRRSRAFLPNTLPRKPTIFLTAPLSHAAMAKLLAQCERGADKKMVGFRGSV